MFRPLRWLLCRCARPPPVLLPRVPAPLHGCIRPPVTGVASGIRSSRAHCSTTTTPSQSLQQAYDIVRLCAGKVRSQFPSTTQEDVDAAISDVMKRLEESERRQPAPCSPDDAAAITPKPLLPAPPAPPQDVDSLWEELSTYQWSMVSDGVQMVAIHNAYLVLNKEKNDVFLSKKATGVYINHELVMSLEEARNRVRNIFEPYNIDNMLPSVKFDELNQAPGIVNTYIDRKDLNVNTYSVTDITKRCVHVCAGDSGSGKTMYACMQLPRQLCPDGKYKVFHWVLNDSDNEDKAIMQQLDKIYKERLASATFGEMLRRHIALGLIQNNLERHFLSFVDEALESSFKSSKSIVCEAVVDRLKREISVSPQHKSFSSLKDWLKNDSLPEESRYNGTLYLVIDEIYKCLSLGRAIIGLQSDLYKNEWIRSHFRRIEFILCGTGSEEYKLTSSWRIATDPRRVEVIDVRSPPTELKTILREKITNDVVRTALESSRLFCSIEGNARLLTFAYDIVYRILMFTDYHDVTEYSIARGINTFVFMALDKFRNHNGLVNNKEWAERVSDAMLMCALEGKTTPVALAPLADQVKEELLQRAVGMGYVVRINDSGDGRPCKTKDGLVCKGLEQGHVQYYELTRAMCAVATFAFSAPHNGDVGEAMEELCVVWVKRLLDTQCPSPAATIQYLEGQVPTHNNHGITEEEVRQLVTHLQESRAVVLRNGAKAPGADVIIIQLFDAPSNHIAARVTMISVKTKVWSDTVQELGKLGVMVGRDRSRLLGPLWFALAAAQCASRNKIDNIVKTLVSEGRKPERDLRKAVKTALDNKRIQLVPVLMGGDVGVKSGRYTHFGLMSGSEFDWVDDSCKKYIVCGKDSFGPLGDMLPYGKDTPYTSICQKR